MKATPSRSEGHVPEDPARRGVPTGAGREAEAPMVRRLLRLQRSAGNAAVARLVDRGPVVQRLTAAELIDQHSGLLGLDELALARELARRLPGEPGLVRDVLNQLPGSDKDDVSFELVKALDFGRLSQASTALRIDFIAQMVSGWVTDEEETQISRIWSSFGDSLPAVASANLTLWERSVAESELLNEHPQVVSAREAFPQDVLNLARRYLQDNKKGVTKEAQRLGLNIGGGPAGDAVAEPGYLDMVKDVARQVLELEKKLKAFRGIQVGYSTIVDPLSGWPVGFAPAYFDPEAEPELPGKAGDSPALPEWSVTKAQYDRVDALVRGFANQHPSVYVLIREENLEALTQAGDAAQAGVVIADSLRHSQEKIAEAEGKLGGGIAYYDLVPLHRQLLTNSAGLGFSPQRPWHSPFYGMLANELLADQASREFWVDLGLSLTAAAALIAVPFTAGASGAFLVGFGLGLGASQAAMSWQRYNDLATARDANVSDDLALVASGQVDAALAKSVLDTVSVFLDAYGAGTAGLAQRAARQAAFKEADTALRQRLLREARARAVKEAKSDAAMTAAGAGLAIAEELLAEDPAIAAQVEHMTFFLPEPAPVQPAVSRVVQRSSLEAQLGSQFETYVETQVRQGKLGVPQMDFVIPMQYTGSGWGIDRLGISIDPATGAVNVYHLEMKFRVDPKLDRPKVGTQTGRAWTRNAVEGLIKSQHPKARAAKERLRRALKRMHPGKTIDIAAISEFLHGRVIDAPVFVFVPETSNLTRMYRQLRGLVLGGRKATAVKVRLPK